MESKALTPPIARRSRAQEARTPSSHKTSSQAKLIGPGVAGLLELLLFHPIDTAAKRLMSNQQPVFAKNKPFSTSFTEVGSIVFKGEQKNILSKYLALLP